MSSWTAEDGSAINFDIIGRAPGKETLLLLPGLLGSISTQWNNFANALAQTFQVVMLDIRGHGRSDNNQPKLDLELIVRDCFGLMDYLQVPEFHVAGYNIGGYIALLLHLHQPRRVPTILVHGTKFYWTKESVANMRKQFDPDELVSKVPAYADQLAREHGGSRWRALVRQSADLVGFLAEKGITEGVANRIQCPVIVSVGDRDELVPLPEAQRLSRILPKGELLVLPGVRHPFPSIKPIPLLPMMQYFHQTNQRR